MPDSENPLAQPRQPGWPRWLAVGLMVLGVVASVGLGFWTEPLPPPVVTESTEGEGTEVAPRRPDPNVVFLRLQGEIAAAQLPEQRISAALAMVDFLIQALEWRPENERQQMAREYLLALAEMKLEGTFRFLVARQLFDLALVLQDSELLAGGETLLRTEPITGEPMPFDLLCAEVDALLELGDPATVYMRLDELGERTDSPDGFRPHLLRVTRGLRRALEDEGAMRALCAHRNVDGETATRATILAELAEKASVVVVCGLTPMEAEGLWHQAYIARQRGEPALELDLLQQVIAKGPSAVLALAYIRVAERMQEEKRDMDYAVMLGRMIDQPDLRRYALSELLQRLRSPATNKVAQELLRVVDQVVIKEGELAQPLAQLLLVAGQMAIEQGWMPLAEHYLEQAEALTLDRELLADSMAMKAEIAQSRGEREKMIRAYQEVINLYPDHPQEADIRFLLLQEMATRPYSEADLVGGIIGAITRLPKDPRGIRGLLVVAKRLEDLQLNELAETYYRLAVLLSTMQQARDVGGSTAEGLLGQARVMAAQGKLAEADSLLRVINTNVRWSDIWSTSGPLWATLAFRQGQFREGVRRWRNTCGPLGGELLPYLFGLLAPDLAEDTPPIARAQPRKPGRMPQELVESAVAEVMLQLFKRDDYAGVEHLLNLIENDPDWGTQLELDEYRMRVLEGLAEHDTFDRTVDWLQRHPVQISAAGEPVAVPVTTTNTSVTTAAVPGAAMAPVAPEKTELTKWLENVEAIRSRVRTLPQ